MATQRFISLSSGHLTEVVPVTTSSGTASAGSIPALNANGQIDSTIVAGGVYPVLDVSVGNPTTPGTQTIANAFTTIVLGTVNTDTASGWNTTTNVYTIPITGTYLIVSKLRFNDNTTANISAGQGVNTSNVDGPWFGWFETNAAAYQGTARNGNVNTRILYATSGTQLNMYAYFDAGGGLGTVYEAALNIVLISPA